jgi:hypothetical protein
MEEKKLSQEESMLIIRQMIETAKQEQKDDGKGWIAWGWLLFIVSILSYFNTGYRWFDAAFFWNLFGGIVLAWMLFLIGRRVFANSPRRVKTYTSDLFDKLNGGFFIFLVLIIFSMNLGVPPGKGFMLLVGLYGFWILIYGTALNFKPSIIAAYVTWAIGFAGLFIDRIETVPEDRFKWVMLFHAFAVLCGYIIPGHIAYKNFAKTGRK